MEKQDCILYRCGYKYQLAKKYQISTSFQPQQAILTEFIDLTLDGILTIKSGYAWDGVSGPVYDSEHNMRASLVHDALYQLIRAGALADKSDRKKADQLFKKLCIEDGVLPFFARTYYRVLRRFGKKASQAQSQKRLMQAPHLVISNESKTNSVITAKAAVNTASLDQENQ